LSTGHTTVSSAHRKTNRVAKIGELDRYGVPGTRRRWPGMRGGLKISIPGNIFKEAEGN